MTQVIASSVTSPTSNKQGKEVPVKPLQLNEIPAAMDKMGWRVSAKLMRHWFSIEPAWKMTVEIKRNEIDQRTLTDSQYNDQIVTMDWVLGFERARQAVNQLYKTWASPAGIKELKKKLTDAGWTPESKPPFPLGQGIVSARMLNAVCQVNFAPVGSKWDPLDDFYGAIGMGTFHIAVIGTAKGTTFTVEKLGIYLRDTYDFLGDDEFLGAWSRERCLTSKADTAAFMALHHITPEEAFEPITFALRAALIIKYTGFVPVWNKDFHRWQDKHNKGGDFVVYSDVYWVQPNRETLDLA